MEKNDIHDKVYAKIDELPTLPVMLPRLLSLMERDKTDASDISEIIARDPALTSKILKVANSAYYGFQQEVSDLGRAVPLLGFNMLKSLALSIGVISNLSSRRKKTHFSHEGLWIHSLATATVIQEIGKSVHRKEQQEHLFVVGLLHDIGKVVLDQFFGDLFEDALQEAQNRGTEPLYRAERRVIGIDHGEVGAMLLRRWKFPAQISYPIAVHHEEIVPEGINGRDVAMLRIADILPQEIELGEAGNPVPSQIPAADLCLLGIEDDELQRIKTHLAEVQEGIHSFFTALS